MGKTRGAGTKLPRALEITPRLGRGGIGMRRQSRRRKRSSRVRADMQGTPTRRQGRRVAYGAAEKSGPTKREMGARQGWLSMAAQADLPCRARVCFGEQAAKYRR